MVSGWSEAFQPTPVGQNSRVMTRCVVSASFLSGRGARKWLVGQLSMVVLEGVGVLPGGVLRAMPLSKEHLHADL